MNLLWAEVVRNHSSSKSIERKPESTLDSETEEESDWNIKILIEEDLIQTEQDISAELKFDRLKTEKKSEKMLVTDKTCDALSHITDWCCSICVWENSRWFWRLMWDYLN